MSKLILATMFSVAFAVISFTQTVSADARYGKPSNYCSGHPTQGTCKKIRTIVYHTHCYGWGFARYCKGHYGAKLENPLAPLDDGKTQFAAVDNIDTLRAEFR